MNTARAMLSVALLLAAATRAAAQNESQEKLTFYGFFDLQAEGTSERGGPAWSFDQHRSNVVSIYQLEDRWRVFTEIEYEHGPQLAADEASSGEVLLERAVLEYQRSKEFEVRIGKFLTPFGLYNESHDVSPSILSTVLPSSVYSEGRITPSGTGKLCSRSLRRASSCWEQL